MHPGSSGPSDFFKLGFLQQAEGHADSDIRLVSDGADAFADLFDFTFRQLSSGGDNGVTQNSAGFGPPGSLQKLFRGQKAVGFRAFCLVMRALGAVSAVLGAASAFPVDDGAQIKALPAFLPADLVGGVCQLLQRSLRQHQRLLKRNLPAGQRLFFQFLYYAHSVLLLFCYGFLF